MRFEPSTPIIGIQIQPQFPALIAETALVPLFLFSSSWFTPFLLVAGDPAGRMPLVWICGTWFTGLAPCFGLSLIVRREVRRYDSIASHISINIIFFGCNLVYFQGITARIMIKKHYPLVFVYSI